MDGELGKSRRLLRVKAYPSIAVLCSDGWPGLKKQVKSELTVWDGPRVTYLLSPPKNRLKPVMVSSFPLMRKRYKTGFPGLYLAVRKELFSLLPVSAAGFALAWFYTAAPAYKYRALGELGIFLCFGPLLVAGTVLIQTGKILPEAALASIPTGLLIVGILFANNLRDLKTDSEKGIKTLPGLLGEKRALVFYFFLVLFPYPAALYSLGFSPAFLITAVSLPMAVNLLSLAKKGKFHVLVRENAKFVGIFGLLFSLSIFFGK